VEVNEVALSIPDDLDGSSAALRGWLMSAGPDVPWRVLPPAPSEGQGIAEQIALSLESSAALVAVYDRVRLWISRRGKHAKPVTAVTVVEIDGTKYELIVTLNPLENDHGRTA
jgi:hypothetical protein